MKWLLSVRQFSKSLLILLSGKREKFCGPTVSINISGVFEMCSVNRLALHALRKKGSPPEPRFEKDENDSAWAWESPMIKFENDSLGSRMVSRWS